MNQVLYRIEPHYNRVAASLPSFLQDKLYHDPRSLNPLQMVTSSLAHADWWHLAGNLVFFYAFAAPVEAVVGSLIFAGAFVALSFFVGIAYTVFCFFTGDWTPTLGLSGVVMGTIGMAGYLMPKARINTVLAAGVIGWKFAIPAWILAIFFILSDLLDMFGGAMADSSVNFLAHVAGGIGGYVGAAAFLRRIKEQHQDDIDEALELAEIDRVGGKGSLARERVSRRQIEAERRVTAEREARERFQRLLFRLVSVDNSPRAVLLLLEDYENWRCSPEIYEQLFEEIGEVKRGRTWLCVGRLCIHLYAEMGRFGKAVAVADRLLEVYPRLELCSPDQALQVAHEAIAMHRERLAKGLVQQPEQRYRGHLDAVAAHHLLAQLA